MILRLARVLALGLLALGLVTTHRASTAHGPQAGALCHVYAGAAAFCAWPPEVAP